MRHAFCLLLVAWLGWSTSLQAATIDSAQLVQAARSQVGVTLGYDPVYRRLDYPGGDVPLATGVCTDVLIRALRQQIAEKQAELQALMTASGVDPQLQQMRVEALRSELSSLQGAALSTAQASLVDALKDKRLSDDQRMQAASLAMA